MPKTAAAARPSMLPPFLPPLLAAADAKDLRGYWKGIGRGMVVFVCLLS